MTAIGTSGRIFNAAKQLLHKEGSGAVTMRRVADAVSITPMAVYRHFPNRAGLLNALANEGFEELTSRLEAVRTSGSYRKRLIKLLDVYLEYALQNPKLFELMFLNPREGARRYPQDFQSGQSPTATQMAEIVEEGVKAGYFQKDDHWEIVFEMGALLQGLVMLFLGGRIDLPPAEFRALCHRSFERYIHGIRK